MDDTIIDRLKDATRDAKSFTDASDRLRRSDEEEDDSRLAAFVSALAYSLLGEDSPRRERTGFPFGSMLAGDGWQFPDPLDQLADGVTAS